MKFFFPACLLVLACERQAPEEPASSTSEKAAFLALGDSYTIGQGVEEAARFPHQAVALLRQQGVILERPEYLAQTGWTTVQLLAAIEKQLPMKQYQIVTLLIGVNDQFRGMDTGRYAQSFEACLQKAISLAGNNRKCVIVLSIPDYSITPVGKNWDPIRTSREIDLFNLVNRRICLFSGVPYIDITDSTRLAATDPRRVTTDGLHPSQIEYAAWARMLVPVLRTCIP